MSTAKRKRQNAFPIIFFVALAAAVFLWMKFIVPGFMEKEQEVRSESAVLEKNIVEIEEMKGSAAEIDQKIQDAKDRIKEKYEGRGLNPQTAAGRIEEACANAGLEVEDVKIDIGPGKTLSPAGKLARALCSAEITIVFEDTELRGAAVIRNLENSVNADFEVKSFVFLALPIPEEEANKMFSGWVPIGEWTIKAQLYYYE